MNLGSNFQLSSHIILFIKNLLLCDTSLALWLRVCPDKERLLCLPPCLASACICHCAAQYLLLVLVGDICPLHICKQPTLQSTSSCWIWGWYLDDTWITSETSAFNTSVPLSLILYLPCLDQCNYRRGRYNLMKVMMKMIEKMLTMKVRENCAAKDAILGKSTLSAVSF